jgi:phosphotransferase system  glucose/maltose/N-acetylglucosamine-specific IIC component
MKIFINWFLFLLIIGGIIAAVIYRHWIGQHLPELPAIHPTHAQVIIIAFSCAFVWVYVLKWGVIKPFNCVTCMCGYFSLILGCWSIGFWGVAYMPVGMTVAALYSEVRMRWL